MYTLLQVWQSSLNMTLAKLKNWVLSEKIFRTCVNGISTCSASSKSNSVNFFRICRQIRKIFWGVAQKKRKTHASKIWVPRLHALHDAMRSQLTWSNKDAEKVEAGLRKIYILETGTFSAKSDWVPKKRIQHKSCKIPVEHLKTSQHFNQHRFTAQKDWFELWPR